MATVGQPLAATDPQSANFTNGYTESPDTLPPAAPAAATNKKGKGKKEKYGPDETAKLLSAKISQLEQDAAGEKDQEAEIGAYSPGPVLRTPHRHASRNLLRLVKVLWANCMFLRNRARGEESNSRP